MATSVNGKSFVQTWPDQKFHDVVRCPIFLVPNLLNATYSGMKVPSDGICKKHCVSGGTLQLKLGVSAPNSFLPLLFARVRYKLTISYF